MFSLSGSFALDSSTVCSLFGEFEEADMSLYKREQEMKLFEGSN